MNTEAQTTATTTETAETNSVKPTHKFDPGFYEAKVLKAVVGRSTNSKTPGIFLSFHVEGMGQFRGTLWLSPKAMPSTVEMLKKSFGIVGNEGFAQICRTIEQKPCQIKVQMEADLQGREWPRLRFVNPPGFRADSVDTDTLAELDAMLNSGASEQQEGDF